MNDGKIKVLVVEDSAFMRLVINDILHSDSSIKVIGSAVNGQEALLKTKALKPDVVLMDMIMPDYDGVYGVKQIMNNCPTPIVILSSVGNNNINPIMKALELGAFDYLNKPSKNNAKIREINLAIIKKVKQASHVDIEKLKRKKGNSNTHPHTFPDKLKYDIIVMGASTGGPNAIENIVTKLPSNLKVPVIIGQHMPQNFIESFATRIDNLIDLQVNIGSRGMPVVPGRVIIAPGHRNMVVKRNETSNEVVVDFTFKNYKEYNHPSINAIMSSAAKAYKERTIGVILTGMGKDGAMGIKEIKEKGGYTIAQDKATSIVHGMPREAIENGDIDSIVPIYDIGGFLINCLS